MSRVSSFPPVCGQRPRCLVLGSMPGEASLRAGQYYAHPRNAFWPIMQALLGIDPALPYARRLAALKAGRLAVWDVLHSCERRGSLDASIDTESAVPNDLPGLLAGAPTIEAVCFNGRLAEAVFRRHVLPQLPAARVALLHLARLPSSSPANASWSFERKVAAWRAALGPRLTAPPAR